jgi:hypothetical protein
MSAKRDDSKGLKIPRIDIQFNHEENMYNLKVDDKDMKLTRESAVLLQNILTKKLRETPVLFQG